MRAFVGWFARNPVASNLLMVALVIGGLAQGLGIKVELFPEFSLDTINVRVVYPGAAPEEIEEAICIPIEEEVHSIEGVDEVNSTSSEGVGSVLIEVASGEDPRRVLDDVKTRVDAIETFPEEAERPIIEEVVMRFQVINVAVYGDAPEVTLKGLAEEVRDEINALDGISQVELLNVRPYEVSIEVSEEALRRYGATFDEVAAAVRSSSLDLSGGSVKAESGEILLRTVGQAYRQADFERIVVRTLPDGTRVHVADVARVVDGFADVDQEARFDGKPVAMVQVYRVGDESALDVSAKVLDYVDRKAAELPSNVSITTWQDNAQMLRSRIELLTRNGLQGLALVFLVLALFLRFRLSFWVTLGIPISFLGAVLVMPLLGQSVNMLSLFAFILVLGIVVDDAIVVGESIYTENERSGSSVQGAVRGVQLVSIPVIFAVLTTVAAFFPLIGLPGVLGKFFEVIPLTVIPALLFSLVESQVILPSHLAHESARIAGLSRHAPFSWWTRFQGLCAGGLLWFRDRVYAPALELALEWRYVTVAAAVTTLLLTLGIVTGGFQKFVFFADIEGDIVAADLTMPQGSSAQGTGRALHRVEAAAQDVIEELEGEGHFIVRNFMSSVGEQPYLATKQSRQSADGGPTGPQFGEVVVELIPAEEREITTGEFVRRWRERVGRVPGAVELSYDSSLMSVGQAIFVRLSGPDIDELKVAAAELKESLAQYNGVVEITDSFRGGKEELVIDVLPAGEALGLTRLDVARQVRQAFYGEEAERLQRGRDDVKVMVRYPRDDRRSLFGVEEMRVRTAAGDEVPLSSVASTRFRRGYATIRRSDRRRTIDVTADVDLTRANPDEVKGALAASVLPALLEHHPGVTWAMEGQSNEQAQLAQAMGRDYVLALFAIFALLAIPFRSYVQPLIVMTAIPFGLVGAIAGHAIMGIDLSMLSVLGLAALSGVVVNDSLVLVDYVNRRRSEGLDVPSAAHEAGLARFRPILLTSMTTFAGLTPLILERSVQAQFLVPMAVSLAFGVVFSTVVSLVLVPAGYLVLDDLQRVARWLYGRPEARAEPA